MFMIRPRIGKAPAVDHEIRPAMWPGFSPSSPIVRPIAVMYLQIVEADRQLARRYVVSGPHCWAMWIGLTESRGAGGTDQTAGC
jgi:hypothetical protein